MTKAHHLTKAFVSLHPKFKKGMSTQIKEIQAFKPLLSSSDYLWGS